jgi:hypothetical protein
VSCDCGGGGRGECVVITDYGGGSREGRVICDSDYDFKPKFFGELGLGVLLSKAARFPIATKNTICSQGLISLFRNRNQSRRKEEQNELKFEIMKKRK